MINIIKKNLTNYFLYAILISNFKLLKSSLKNKLKGGIAMRNKKNWLTPWEERLATIWEFSPVELASLLEQACKDLSFHKFNAVILAVLDRYSYIAPECLQEVYMLCKNYRNVSKLLERRQKAIVKIVKLTKEVEILEEEEGRLGDVITSLFLKYKEEAQQLQEV